MRNKLLQAITIALLVSGLVLPGCMADPGSGAEAVKYTLYIGLNDKDTYTQLLSTAEAVEKVSAIALKHADGFTLYHGQGAYLDDQGVETFENCLILEF